jgi:hypothetical protein
MSRRRQVIWGEMSEERFVAVDLYPGSLICTIFGLDGIAISYSAVSVEA